jgi:hypothetical protein
MAATSPRGPFEPAQRRRRLPGRQQIAQKHTNWLRDLAVRPNDTVRLTIIARGHEPTRPRHHEPGQIAPLFLPRFDHADKVAVLTKNVP